MGFRDQGAADQARIQALEGELAEARAEAEQLRATRRAARPAAGGRGAAAIVLGSVAVGVVAAGVAAYLGFGISGRIGEEAGVVLGALAVGALNVAAIVAIASRCLVVARPSEILVVVGRERVSADGQRRGYRVVRGGRVLRMPFIEQVHRLDGSPARLDVTLSGLHARGGALALRVAANVRISTDPSAVHRAVERFLDRDLAEMAETAREVLEGACRAAAAEAEVEKATPATLTDAIANEARQDLDRLGLELDLFEVVEATPSRR